MPKITRLGGVSDKNSPAPEPKPVQVTVDTTQTDKRLADLLRQAARAHEPEGGEQPSPGNSSSPSVVRSEKSNASSKPAGQKRARAAGSPSKKRGASSTAGSTAGPATSSDK